MIVRIAARGRNFVGAQAYYMHDKGADTSDRVAWTHTENIGTQDAGVAFRWMAATAIAANEAKEAAHTRGRRIEKPVWTIALSWDPGEEPTREHMIGTARSWLTARKLQGHQVVMVSHQDEGYRHVHLIVNLVDTSTLKINKAAPSHAKRQSSLWAERYEREHGIKCQQRVVNNARRAQGERVRYDGSDNFRARVTSAYRNSDSGQAFVDALKEYGYSIAQGRRLVVIDREGKPHALFRQIENVPSAEIKQRLEGLRLQTLKDRSREDSGARELTRRQRREQRHSPRQKDPAGHFDLERQDRESDARIIGAGIRQGAVEEVRDRKEQVRSDDLRNLQDRRLVERRALSDLHRQARLQLDARLERQYGEDYRQLRAQITGLEKALETKRLFFPRKAKEKELETLRKSVASIEQRRQEAVGALEAKGRRERDEFERRTTLEQQAIEDRLTPLDRAAYLVPSSRNPAEVVAPAPPGVDDIARAAGPEPSPTIAPSPAESPFGRLRAEYLRAEQGRARARGESPARPRGPERER